MHTLLSLTLIVLNDTKFQIVDLCKSRIISLWLWVLQFFLWSDFFVAETEKKFAYVTAMGGCCWKLLIQIKLNHECDFNVQNRTAIAGQISAQRCILMVRLYRSKYKEGVDAYIEEAVIRRELSDNFCFYNKNYDKIEGRRVPTVVPFLTPCWL